MSELEFYRETRFKDTEIGRVPAEWEVVRLIDVAEYINGYAFSPKDWKNAGLPIIRIQNLNNPDAEFNYFDGEIDDRYVIENGDLLFSWSGSIGVYIWKRGRAVLNQHIFKVVPKKNVSKLYLYYALFLAIEHLKRKVHGSTMKHFKRGELKTTYISLPPLPEQQKIAEILRSIDEAIGAVEDSITKLERLRKGAMEHLLTRGINHTRFKEVELNGRRVKIPEDWEVIELGNILKLKNGKRPEVLEHGNIPIYGANGIMGYTTEQLVENDYTIVIGRVGASGAVHLARGKVWVSDNAIYSDNYDRSKICLLWLFYFLKFRRLDKFATKTTHPIITQTFLNTFKIPLPPLPEQQKIAEILRSIDEAIEAKRMKKAGLERMKKAVMEKLLTGEVRVR